MTDVGLKHLPLEDIHRDLGARFGAFAGWWMPITYPLGVMKEHLHTRAQAGLFDISHMKLFLLTGSKAAQLLAAACPLDPQALAQGQCKYTFLLNDSAGIVDDLIVTRLGPERFMVVANAGNAARDEQELRRLAPAGDCRIEPLDRVFIAVQGPQAAEVLALAGLDLRRLAFMTGAEPAQNWFASRSGYTGEDGFEIGLPADDARALVAKIALDERAQWIGLAARDSLRLEAGLCLHGQDITEETDPVEAGLLWAIPKELRQGGSYVGAAALAERIAAGPRRRRVGLKPEGRQPVRAGAALKDGAGAPAGIVTSGGFGPSAGYPVAMGYVEAALAAPGIRLAADIRGADVPLAVHPLPFTPHRYRKGR